MSSIPKHDIVEGRIREKLKLIKQLELKERYTSEAIKEQQLDLADTKRRIEALRVEVINVLDSEGKLSWKAPDFSVSLSSKPQSVVIVDENKLNERFLRVKTEPNKTLIGDCLKRGENVEGAMLSNGGVTLTIKST